MAGVIVLDANVLIGFLDSSDIHHDDAVDLLERYVTEGLASSVLTVAEALVHPTRADIQDRALAALMKIGLNIVPLESADAIPLARIRNTYRLRMPDAVALYTAIATGSGLATFDDVVLAAARRANLSIAVNEAL